MKYCGPCGETKPLEEFYEKSPGVYMATCKACRRLRALKRYEENREELKQDFREYRQENLEARREADRQRRLKNGDEIRARNNARAAARRDIINARQRDYYQRNKTKCILLVINRQEKVKRATPLWVDFAAIQAIYEEAARLTAETGIPHDVDHEIPLQGKTVSGLHVHTNMRILTATENRQKSNKFEAA